MKNCFRILFALMLPISLHAFEGVLTYNISSNDRDWKMVCSVKDPYLRADIYLGSTHFQTIMKNDEGLLLLDEMNHQVIVADQQRMKWGKPDEKQYKEKESGDYELEGSFNEKGFSGNRYSIRSKRRHYYVELVEGMGAMPGIFLDQFSGLRALYEDGKFLFKDHSGMPVRIYRKGKEFKPMLELVDVKKQPIAPSVFDVADDYVRAKMRFKMR